ncbi:MAG: HNH endonuclease [Candidatus Kapabacteria bacterium]|nr:HNH endonuclease [Candidatus Kapabacteria bacterium]
MKLYLGVTDRHWYNHLAAQNPPVSEVNFWKPGGGGFAALDPGCPFVFKLKAPVNKIAGVGFFHSYTRLPLRLAWETFTIQNGRDTYEQFNDAISKYNKHAASALTEVGCVLLESPVFFDEPDWIDVPPDWSDNIVSGKGYDTHIGEGAILWKRIEALLLAEHGKTSAQRPSAVIPSVFGKEYLRKSRPGQAGFRIGLTEAYQRRCAITGENILPVLQAAHIQPVHKEGTNDLTNGLLLRSDMHTLYDDGLIGITPDYEIRISERIREEYVNGKIYYNWDGKRLSTLPKDEHLWPHRERLEWHMGNVFER